MTYKPAPGLVPVFEVIQSTNEVAFDITIGGYTLPRTAALYTADPGAPGGTTFPSGNTVFFIDGVVITADSVDPVAEIGGFIYEIPGVKLRDVADVDGVDMSTYRNGEYQVWVTAYGSQSLWYGHGIRLEVTTNLRGQIVSVRREGAVTASATYKWTRKALQQKFDADGAPVGLPKDAAGVDYVIHATKGSLEFNAFRTEESDTHWKPGQEHQGTGPVRAALLGNDGAGRDFPYSMPASTAQFTLAAGTYMEYSVAVNGPNVQVNGVVRDPAFRMHRKCELGQTLPALTVTTGTTGTALIDGIREP